MVRESRSSVAKGLVSSRSSTTKSGSKWKPKLKTIEERRLDRVYEFNPNTDPLSVQLRRYSGLLRGHRLWFDERWRHVQTTEPIGKLTDFHWLKTIESGSFNRVVLVQDKKSRHLYSMKIFDKAELVLQKMERYPIMERRVMQSTTFPFIVPMYHHFKDNSYLYLTTQFIGGGDLRFHLQKQGRFCEEFVVFYSAQVLLALEFLHSNDIIYRDLKPENLQFDLRGYVKLTNLGNCKRMKNAKQRTFTLIGDTEYLSPEIVLSQGYNRAADYWAFGVIVFELLAGYSPFHAHPKIKIYECIVANRPRFPPHVTYSARQSIKRFLRRDVNKRAGNLRNGVDGIKRQHWFLGLNWDALLHQTYDTRRVMRFLNPGGEPVFDDDDIPEQTLKVASEDLYGKEFEGF